MIPRRFISLCLTLVIAVQPLMCCCVVAELTATLKAAEAKQQPTAKPACCCCPDAPSAPQPNEAPPPRPDPCACDRPLAAATLATGVSTPADDGPSPVWLVPPAELPVAATVELSGGGGPFPFPDVGDFLYRCHFLRC
ncbi:MAG: hypothetical protein ACJ8F7_02580 [Gemmataceae bacterium]